MSRTRAPRQHKDNEDDAFVAKVLEFNAWAQNNSQKLILGVAALLIVVVGIVYYVNWTEAQRARAVQDLERIQQTVGFGDPEAAKAELGQYLLQYSDGPEVLEARLILGELYLQSVEPAQAVSVLEPTRSEMDEPLGVQAGFLLAAAYEELGQWADAEQTYLEIADEAELDFQVRNALDGAARIRASAENHQGAVDLYERLLETFEEGDPGRSQFELRLAEVRARIM